jgi:hypothetical protein
LYATGLNPTPADLLGMRREGGRTWQTTSKRHQYLTSKQQNNNTKPLPPQTPKRDGRHVTSVFGCRESTGETGSKHKADNITGKELEDILKTIWLTQKTGPPA